MERRTVRDRIAVILIFTLGFALAGCGGLGRAPAPMIEDPPDALVHTLPVVNPLEHMHLFEYDQSIPIDIQVEDTRHESGLTITNLTYASPKGGRVPTTLMVPDGKGPFAGLIVMHGMPSTRLDFGGQGQEYASHGMVVVLIDAPFNRPEKADRPWWRGGIPLTLREDDVDDQIQLIVDLRRAVDLLAARPDVDPDRIAYLGLSYGGAMGGLLAGVEDRLKAAVLIVGEGGLVTHLTGNDDRDNWYGSPYFMLTEDRKEPWMSGMWPIEPIHYVSQAAPTALLFQNATRDGAVPASDALRYQAAGSKPKDIEWYDSPHFPLPRQAQRDNVRWLLRYIGPSPLKIFPSFRASAVAIDALLISWMVLTVGSAAILVRDMRRAAPVPLGARMFWLLVVAFFGPLTLVIYSIAQRPLRKSTRALQDISIGKRTLAATMWAASANMVGVIIAFEIDLRDLPLEQEYLLFPLLLHLLIPIGAGVVAVLVASLLSSKDQDFRLKFKRPAYAEIISTSFFLIGFFPLAISLIRRQFPFGLSTLDVRFWSWFLPSLILGVVLSFPLNYWMMNRGIIRWGGAVKGARKAAPIFVGLVGTLSLILVVGVILLTVKLVADIPFDVMLQWLMPSN